MLLMSGKAAPLHATKPVGERGVRRTEAGFEDECTTNAAPCEDGRMVATVDKADEESTS